MYFDYNATHPILTEILEWLQSDSFKFWGNPSSAHHLGRDCKDAIESARETLASALGCAHQDVQFCSGATEANHDLIRSYIRAFPQASIYLSKVEHPCVLSACELSGADIHYLPWKGDEFSGSPDWDSIANRLCPNDLIICMAVNNETGQRFPVDKVGAIAKLKGAWLHCDAVQGFMKVDLDYSVANSISISAHKLGGLSGVGALICKDFDRVPLIPGSQERGRRGGTENLLGIQVFERTVQLWSDKYNELYKTHVLNLRHEFEKQLKERMEDVFIHSKNIYHAINTMNIRFANLDGESLLFSLDMAGIQCSLGSACSSGSIEPSHVLLAMGLEAKQAKSSLRFSFGVYNSMDEIESLLDQLESSVKRLRNLSRPK